MPLTCPKCRHPLEKRVVKGTDVEHCAGCSGVWFDRGKLGRILRHGGRDALRALSLAHVELAEDGRRDWQLLWYDEQGGECPRCLQLMARRETKERRGLFLDECDTCGGTWFDGAKVDDLLSAERRGLKAWLLGLLGGAA